MIRRSPFLLGLILLYVVSSIYISFAQDNGTISIIADSQNLSIIVTGEKSVKLSELGFKVVDDNSNITFYYLKNASDIRTVVNSDALPGTCIVLSRSAASSPGTLPGKCKNPSVQSLTSIDVFWYNTLGNQPVSFAVVQGDDELTICGNTGAECLVNLLPPTPTPTPPPPPDIDQIAFLSDRTGKLDIFLMDVDGKNVVNLSNTPDDNEIHPSWSPDGNQLTYHSDKDPNNPQIYVLDVNTHESHNVTNNYIYSFAPSWSPDGTQIAFIAFPDGKGDIFTIQPDGANIRQVTHLETSGCGLDNPVWSPDSKTIAYSSDCEGNHEIYFADVETGKVTRITNNDVDDFTPVFSPDGKQIAFVSKRDGNAEIYIMNIDGTSPQNISNDSADDYAPAWSPDGTRIAFNSFRNSNWDIYVMKADGSDLQRLTSDSATEEMPAWRPRPKS